MNRAWRWLAGVLATGACITAPAQDVHDALRVGDLICEFREGWRHTVLADLRPDPAPARQMLFFERVGRDTAEVLSTRVPGRKPVTVRRTDEHVHFIERVGPSVRVTSLSDCELRKRRDGVDTCVRFTARHAWHFDTGAVRDPDGSLERQPSGASIGACESWRVD